VGFLPVDLPAPRAAELAGEDSQVYRKKERVLKMLTYVFKVSEILIFVDLVRSPLLTLVKIFP